MANLGEKDYQMMLWTKHKIEKVIAQKSTLVKEIRGWICLAFWGGARLPREPTQLSVCLFSLSVRCWEACTGKIKKPTCLSFCCSFCFRKLLKL